VVARAARRLPTRSCVVCRTSREKRELLRIVRTPDGTVQTDASGRSAGRGAYLCRDATCINIAISRGTLARVLEIPVPAGLLEELAAIVTTDITGGGARGQE
jgi:predicted RNA-binding protein YlxR (DUF448 family)